MKIVSSDQKTILYELVKQAGLEFFRSVNIDASPLAEGEVKKVPVRKGSVFTASLGFSGENIKGALILISYSDAIGCTNPQREYKTEFTTEDHSDWIGEITNQVVGSLKRLINKYSVSFTLATPVVVSGVDTKHSGTSNAAYRKIDFVFDEHKIELNYSIELSPTIDLAEVKDQSEQAAGGDAFLF